VELNKEKITIISRFINPDIKVELLQIQKGERTMSEYDDSTNVTNPSTKIHVFAVKEHVRRPLSFTRIAIDFDEASVAWMANKVRRGPSVCYQCTAIKKDGHPCSKAILSHDGTDQFLCKTHKRFSHLPTLPQTESRSTTATKRVSVSP
jgi:hypothetical protein